MTPVEKFIVGVIVFMILAILGIGFATHWRTWNDGAAAKCQQQYGTYTYHPINEQFCVLSNGDIKGLK